MLSSTPRQSFVKSPHLVAGSPTPGRVPSSTSASTANQSTSEGIENAGRLIDHHLKEDASFTELSGQLRIATHSKIAQKLLASVLLEAAKRPCDGGVHYLGCFPSPPVQL